MEKLEKQKCPLCNQNTLTLTEDNQDIPYFGKCYIFSMSCSNCKYHKADVEAAEIKEPIRYILETASKKDLNIRIVKSSEATIKIPTFRMDSRPGPASEGFITNIEGMLQRFKKIIESKRDETEDSSEKKSVKNLLKKMWKAELGEIPIKIIIEDPTGNSAIISEKVKKEKMK